MSKPLLVSDRCLNCGSSVEGARYCGECGQEHIVQVFSMRQLAGHYVEDFLSLDNRLFRSLWPLLAKPGFLTRKYLQGRRNSYIRPLRLYLLTSIVFFMALRFQYDPGDSIKITRGGETVTFNELSQEERARLDEVTREAIAEAMKDDSGGSDAVDEVMDRVDAAIDSTAGGTNFHFGRVEGWPWLNNYLEEREKRFESMNKVELGRLFLTHITEQAPKAIFLLLPAIAFVLKLLYFRRSRFYMEHFIFSLHWHSFLFVLFTICVFLPWAWLRVILILASPLYLLLALRHYYQQGWIRTVIKHQVVMFSYSVMLPVFATLLGIAAAASI